MPWPGSLSSKACKSACRFRLFELFPVLLAIGLTWLYAYIVTIAGTYDNYSRDSNFYKYCRTDQSTVLSDSPWFRWPYPGQWGGPIFTWSAVLTMLAGALSAMVESVRSLFLTSLPILSFVSLVVTSQCVLTNDSRDGQPSGCMKSLHDAPLAWASRFCCGTLAHGPAALMAIKWRSLLLGCVALLLEERTLDHPRLSDCEGS